MSTLENALEGLPALETIENHAEIKLHIIAWLTKTIAKTANISSLDIDLTKAFDDYGLDSIAAIRLVGNLSDWLGEEISANKLYQFQQINELVDYLSEVATNNAKKLAKAGAAKKRLIIAASFTAEPVIDSFNYWTEQLALNLDIRFAPYNQIFQELISPHSQIRTNNNGINTILFRIEDWFRYTQGEIDNDNIISMVKTFVDALNVAITTSTSQWIIALCPHSFTTLIQPELKTKILELDQFIIDQLMNHTQVRFLDLRNEQNYFEIKDSIIFDITRDRVGHIPYSQEYFAGLGLTLTRASFALLYPTPKVIVLDCDNTLWSGVCGEDGVNAIQITPAFQFLQRFMLEQQTQGKLLCLCSKNIEEDVWTVFEQHPDMQLQRQHITAHRINWNAKSQNLKSLAEHLKLSLDSFIFIDDNPAECAEVKANAAGVLVLQLPKASEHIPTVLTQYWAFDVRSITDEDRQRQQMYQQNQQRDLLRAQHESYEDFLAKLAITINIQNLQTSDIARAAQLTERTNQFNATVKRRTEAEIANFIAQPGQHGFTVRVNDRFGDYGLVGLMLATEQDQQLILESFMLSCRVLGKRVEHQMIAHAAKFAMDKGLSSLGLTCVLTARNQPLQTFYTSLGYPIEQAIEVQPRYAMVLTDVESKLTTAKPEYAINAEQTIAPQTVFSTINNSAINNNLQAITDHHGNVEHILQALRSIKKSRPVLTTQYVSPRSTWQLKIAGLWSDILSIEKVGINDNFYELGGDSLRSAELAARLYEIGVPDSVSLSVIANQTVAGLAQAVENKEAGAEVNLVTALASLADEAQLDPALVITPQQLPPLAAATDILLTGSTGYVGAFLLKQLLTGTQATIYCLVRAKTSEEGLARIKKNLAGYELWQEAFSQRIQILLGDLASPSLGLSCDVFNKLAQTIDVVFHNGAWVNFIYPYDVLKPANVDGTKTILHFVTQHKPKALHFISTLGVLMSGGYGRERKLYEDEDLDHSEDLPNGYEQTKWVADKLVWRAMQQGLPASIYRLGMLSGLGNSGVYHKLNEFLPSFLKGCIQMGSFPHIDSNIEMVPIDFIADSLLAIAADPANLGKVYQMNHPYALRDGVFVDWIQNFGYPLRHLPWDIWKKELLGLGKRLRDNALYPYLDFIRALEYHQTYMPEMNMDNFLKVIARNNIQCLSQTELLHNYFSYFINIGYLPKVGSEVLNSNTVMAVIV